MANCDKFKLKADNTEAVLGRCSLALAKVLMLMPMEDIDVIGRAAANRLTEADGCEGNNLLDEATARRAMPRRMEAPIGQGGAMVGLVTYWLFRGWVCA